MLLESPPREDGAAADEDALSSGSANGFEKEFVFKVVVIGSYNVGKTTFVKRLLHTRLPPSTTHETRVGRSQPGPENEEIENTEDEEEDEVTDLDSDPDEIHVSPTVGTDFYSLVVRHVLPKANVRLQLWDTAGLPQYTAVDATTYRNSSLVLCLFDISNRVSLEDVVERHLAQAAEFLPDLEQNRIFVIATKMDLAEDSEDQARGESQRRASSPEAAFCGEDDDETTDLTSSNAGGERRPPHGRRPPPVEELVTVECIQQTVLDLFSEVHYAEVSARRRSGMREVLRRLCFTLLRNEGELPKEAERPLYSGPEDGSPVFDLALHSGLPRRKLPEHAADQGARQSTGKPLTVAHQPLAAPSSPNSMDGPPSVEATAKRLGDSAPATSATPEASAFSATANSGGSWRNTGFAFEMPAPVSLNDMGVFSPSSVPPTPVEMSAVSIASKPGRGPAYADPNAATEPPPLKGAQPPANLSLRNSVGGDGGGATGRGAGAPGANESKEARIAREGAEMAALLGKRSRAGAAGGVSDPSAVDGADEGQDLEGGRFRRGDLDAAEEEERQRRGKGKDDDDDGADFQDAIRDRFAEIDRAAELDRKAREAALKRDKKRGSTNTTATAEKNNSKKKAKEGATVADKYRKEKTKTKCKCAVM